RGADREENPPAPVARVVEATAEGGSRFVQRGQEPGVVDQEDLRERVAPLQANLLPGVGPLGLADLPERPPETRAVVERELEPGLGHADRRRPARRAAPVEVVGPERARHAETLRAEVDVGPENARERVSGGRGQLRLLYDAVQIELTLARQGP